jgi:sulfite exporter TauE/SafE
VSASLALGAAFLGGLAGAAHCAAMCGGIATAAGASFQGGRGLPVAAALSFNAARLAGYALVGALLATAAGAATATLPFAATAGRILAATVLAALALRLLSGRDWLGVERLGAGFWRLLRPAFARFGRLPPRWRPAALGLLWGFMPCGLVYSVLLLAATGGDAASGAATMLAFGVGTLPALVGLTLGGHALGRRLAAPRWRRAAGIAVLAAALWTLGGALLHRPGATHDHAHMHPPASAG